MDVNTTTLEPSMIFSEIEGLAEMHLHEPRVGAQMRAHVIGTHLERRGKVPGRIWALPPENSVIVAPLRGPDGLHLKHVDVDEMFTAGITRRDSERSLMWNHHVAACDMTDRYNPTVYDPVLFSGPVSLSRWMAAFRNPYIRRFVMPTFVLCDWDAGPFGPTPLSARDEEFIAQMNLVCMRLQSCHTAVEYVRSSPAWPGEPPPPPFWVEAD